MRKRWKAGGGLVAHQTHAPPRVDKGKGKARAQEEPMDVDVDFGVLAEEEAVSVPVPVESDVPPTPSEQAASPPSPAWGTAVSLSPEPFAPALLARDPSPPPAVAPAPPPVAKLSFKEWQARRKLQRAKEGEVAQEREREREGQREQECERERQRERENKAAQGEDKENKLVPVKAEDGLSRILNDIRRSTVSDKTPQVEQPARQDVEMADAPPLVVAPGAAPALSPVADFQSKLKASPLSMTALVATENDHLSPLAVSRSCWEDSQQNLGLNCLFGFIFTGLVLLEKS
ncbi:hypothetical protein B0H14DRAFT_3891925 [Mycena olivaceomarginata]|nr:hypothetical protein B0H14DRAFT_3891925 [Mycena olivaceomarginata]